MPGRVGQTEEVELSDAETTRRALRLLGARGGELRSGRDVDEIANAFGAVGGDHEMGFASLSREPGQEWSDDAFIVRVREHGDDGPGTLSVRRERHDRSECQGDEGMYGDTHERF